VVEEIPIRRHPMAAVVHRPGTDRTKGDRQ
jgi:hypothetical protein